MCGMREERGCKGGRRKGGGKREKDGRNEDQKGKKGGGKTKDIRSKDSGKKVEGGGVGRRNEEGGWATVAQTAMAKTSQPVAQGSQILSLNLFPN